MGFTVKAQKELRRARGGNLPLRIRSHEVNVVGDLDEEVAFEDWVYPTTMELKNWHAKDFVPISFIEE